MLTCKLNPETGTSPNIIFSTKTRQNETIPNLIQAHNATKSKNIEFKFTILGLKPN